jgi:hypothetical protein
MEKQIVKNKKNLIKVDKQKELSEQKKKSETCDSLISKIQTDATDFIIETKKELNKKSKYFTECTYITKRKENSTLQQALNSNKAPDLHTSKLPSNLDKEKTLVTNDYIRDWKNPTHLSCNLVNRSKKQTTNLRDISESEKESNEEKQIKLFLDSLSELKEISRDDQELFTILQEICCQTFQNYIKSEFSNCQFEGVKIEDLLTHGSEPRSTSKFQFFFSMSPESIELNQKQGKDIDVTCLIKLTLTTIDTSDFSKKEQSFSAKAKLTLTSTQKGWISSQTQYEIHKIAAQVEEKEQSTSPLTISDDDTDGTPSPAKSE